VCWHVSILDAFSQKESACFGMRQVDFGGPASGGVLSVTFSGDVARFNKLLAKKGLNYRLKPTDKKVVVQVKYSLMSSGWLLGIVKW
jgi:hypothetical protein